MFGARTAGLVEPSPSIAARELPQIFRQVLIPRYIQSSDLLNSEGGC